MKNTVEVVKQCLDNNEISYHHNEERDSFFFNVSCKSKDLNFFIQVHGEEYISFIAGLPIAIPKDSYANVCQTLNEINAEAMIATLYL